MPDQELSAELSREIIQLDHELKGIEPNQKKRSKILKVLAGKFTTTFKSHIGPIPSPEALKQYDDILPGTAERLVAMAERQSNHRIELERHVIERQLSDSRLGQYLGGLISVLFLGASYSLGMNGHDALAGILGGTTLVALVTVFVVGKNKQSQNLQSKA